MEHYYFLFSLALLWTLFATVHDIKKREVANWLNYSLIAFALAYRLFYSLITKNYQFVMLGILGFVIFLGIAHLFYYTKIFAGGDAKLLMGLGIILPYANYLELITTSLIFILTLLTVGAVYSMLYTVIIIQNNKKKFKAEFKNYWKKHKKILPVTIISSLILALLSLKNLLFLSLSILSITPLVYVYTKSIEKCMLVLVSPDKLTEGDWLEKDIKIKNKIIKKTVHGLSYEEINLLKKAKKKVLIKKGIPFVPAFLIALIIMVFFFLTSKLSLASFFLP
ncbi:MAG: A24 family peptidase [Nanoarchaeota archaeon]